MIFPLWMRSVVTMRSTSSFRVRCLEPNTIRLKRHTFATPLAIIVARNINNGLGSFREIKQEFNIDHISKREIEPPFYEDLEPSFPTSTGDARSAEASGEKDRDCLPANAYSDSIEISACILSWNTLDMVRRTLDLLRSELKDIPHQIIVVDNGSRDGTVEYLSKQRDVKLIANAENLGISRGRNQFIDAAQGRYILSIDGDVLPPKNAIMLMYLGLKESDGLDGIGFHYLFSERDETEAPVELTELDTFTERQTAGFVCGMFKKSVFQYCRFDEEGFGGPGWGYEDQDFMKQMQKHGMVMETIKAKFYHATNSSIPQLSNFREVNEQRREYFQRKWSEETATTD